MDNERIPVHYRFYLWAYWTNHKCEIKNIQTKQLGKVVGGKRCATRSYCNVTKIWSPTLHKAIYKF